MATPLVFNSIAGGVPLGWSPSNFQWVSRMAKVPNAVEILQKIWKAWVGRTNVTDARRQTDGRYHIANVNVSSRSLKTPFTWYNRLSIRLNNNRYNIHRFDNRLDKRLYRVYKRSTGCPTGCSTACALWQPRLSNRLRRVNEHSTGCQTSFDNRLNVCLHDAAGCSTGLRTRCMSCKRDLRRKCEHSQCGVLNYGLTLRRKCFH